MVPFSVTISVYKNDKPEYFKIAIDSILEQSLPPNEIILTVDGPVSDVLNSIIERYEYEKENLKVVRLPKNVGIGIAHKIGVECCSNSLIAIMDSDDIAVSDRFEMQLRYFEKHKDVDVVGGYISEFIDNTENIVGIRDVPLTDIAIKRFLKKRCPMNHVTVMFKRDVLLKTGNYENWDSNEDYHLWCKMLLNKCIFGNIPTVLVNVRIDKNMYKRRGGWKYFRTVAKLQKFMFRTKIINLREYIVNISIRFIVQMLITNTMRGFVYRRLFRKLTD